MLCSKCCVLSSYNVHENFLNELPSFNFCQVVYCAKLYIHMHDKWIHGRVGDAVLQLVVTEGLLSRYPEVSLGNLAILRAAMVNRTACLKNAQQLSLHRYLIVGKALERLLNPSRGQSFPYPGGTMSELFEAVMGAIYLDGGFVSTNDWFATAIGWPATFDEGIETYVRQHKHI